MNDVPAYDKYVFFLKLNEELPHFYYDLAHMFSEIGLSLVPVEKESLKEFSYFNKKHVLAVRHDLESFTNFEKARELYLDYLLKHSKIFLTDISSFDKIDLAKKMKLNKSYSHHFLPINLQEIVIRVAYLYYNDKKNQHKWPGGKRGKFPDMPR